MRDTAKRGKTRGNKDFDDEKSTRKRMASAFLNVPHAWFTHFYIVGTIWNAHIMLKYIHSKGNIIDINKNAKSLEGKDPEATELVSVPRHSTVDGVRVHQSEQTKSEMHAIDISWVYSITCAPA